MYRTKSFNEMLAEELKNPGFAKEYLLASMEGEDGMDLLGALKHTISVMGIKEYSEISGMKPSNISRMLSQEEIPKIQTLNKFLAPFKLKVRVEVEDIVA